tara:strand:- start:12742 stop:13296 length:555 start_codon:yes stop_codon:yes gene_type:complete
MIARKLSRIAGMEKPALVDSYVDRLRKPAYIGPMTSTDAIDQTTQDIVDEFAFFDDWVQRYEYIIEMGKALPGLPDDKKDDAHKVPGCQSQVWFHARREGGKIHFDADSDAMIVRGLIALLLRVYSGRTPEEIIATPPEFFEVLELGSHLSGSRANGLHAMVTRIHAYAKAFRDDGNPDAATLA